MTIKSKMIFLTIIYIFCINFISAQFQETIIPAGISESMPYQGFKSCTKYKLKSQNDNTGRLIVNVYEYNNLGQITTEVAYNPDFYKDEEVSVDNSDTIYVVFNEYDSKNRISRKISAGVYSDMMETITAFTYNSQNKKGLLIKKESTSFDPPTSIFKYNKKGILTEINTTLRMPSQDDDDKESFLDVPVYKNVFETDSKGRILVDKLLSVVENEAEISRSVYTYDKKGKINNFKLFDSQGNKYFEESFFFDKSGKIISSVIIDNISGEEQTSYFGYEYK